MKIDYISSEQFDLMTEEELKWLDDAYQHEQFIIEQTEKNEKTEKNL
jgi:hypothetical protein